MAALPRDPDELYQRLHTDAGEGGPPEMLRMAMGVLASDAPSQTRANLYQALMAMPELDITANAVNLDGRHGVALGLPSGTVAQYTAVITDIVDGSAVP